MPRGPGASQHLRDSGAGVGRRRRRAARGSRRRPTYAAPPGAWPRWPRARPRCRPRRRPRRRPTPRRRTRWTPSWPAARLPRRTTTCTSTCSRARWAREPPPTAAASPPASACRRPCGRPCPLHAPGKPARGPRVRSNSGGRGAAQVEAAGEGAVWVERGAVAALNAAVRRAGERKLALMSAIVDFKKGARPAHAGRIAVALRVQGRVRPSLRRRASRPRPAQACTWRSGRRGAWTCRRPTWQKPCASCSCCGRRAPCWRAPGPGLPRPCRAGVLAAGAALCAKHSTLPSMLPGPALQRVGGGGRRRACRRTAPQPARPPPRRRPPSATRSTPRACTRAGAPRTRAAYAAWARAWRRSAHATRPSRRRAPSPGWLACSPA